MPQRVTVLLSDEDCAILSDASEMFQQIPANIAAKMLSCALNNWRDHVEAQAEQINALMNAEPVGHA